MLISNEFLLFSQDVSSEEWYINRIRSLTMVVTINVNVLMTTLANTSVLKGEKLCFLPFLCRGTTFVTSCLLLWAVKQKGSCPKVQKGSSLKGSNETSPKGVYSERKEFAP